MKATPSVIVLTFALLASTAPATPDEGAPKKDKKPTPLEAFEKKDENHDGVLSKEEFVKGAKEPAKSEKTFGLKDKNGDGKLNLQEFKAWVKQPQPQKKKKGK